MSVEVVTMIVFSQDFFALWGINGPTEACEYTALWNIAQDIKNPCFERHSICYLSVAMEQDLLGTYYQVFGLKIASLSFVPIL